MRKINIIILLVFCLTLLLLTCCIANTVISETTSGNLENQEYTEEPVIVDIEESGTVYPQKWSGLGMNIFPSEDSYIDLVLANGFTEVRHLAYYDNADWLANSKAKIINWVAKGAKVVWGVTSNTTITSTNWEDFEDAIISAATWAQANGVYEFQIGNEEETRVDGTTLTTEQIQANLKSVATDVQAIFTNGNVSYTCAYMHIPDWITAGKGDMDILAANIYRGGGGYYDDQWKTQIDSLVNAFGVDGTYLTEFSLSGSALEDYSEDEEVQVAAVTEMIDYIKASGMTRAIYFALKDDGDAHFGAIKNDGTYRLLWNQTLLNSEPVKFATVPAKTTTTSLPNAIALIQK